jgi:hypothetical protein
MARNRTARLALVSAVLLSIAAKTQQTEPRNTSAATSSSSTGAESSTKPPWQYGGFVDLGYLLDFNHPSNHLFRNRGTTPRVDEVDLNMASVYVRKDVSKESRWGMELAAQAGEDSKTFGFSATAPNLAGANFLRHLGRADASYLAPIGKGLTIQAGIFSSLIG